MCVTSKRQKAVNKKSAGKPTRANRPKSSAMPALRRGDIVDIVAPGFATTDAEVDAGVRFLESWGLVPRLPHDLFATDTIASNSDEKRLRHVAHALSAKDSRAVWCLRGGYGAIRLVPGLLKLKKPAHRKMLLGLSDVTTLQLWLQQKWGWSSLQAPLLDRLGRLVDEKLAAEKKIVPIAAHVEELKRVVFGDTTSVLYEGLRPLGGRVLLSKQQVKKSHHIRGAMGGGNLVTFASAIGTAIHPKTDGQIVFFEDIGERGYRLDRLLEQMVQAKVLTAKTKAVVFGEFIGGSEPDGSDRGPAVFERFAATWAKDNRVPVFSGVAMGHGQNQRVVPLGARATLDLVSGSLEVETGIAGAGKSHA